MESELHLSTDKRGGAKLSPVHVGLLILSTVLLTLAGIFLVMEWNFLGVITMLLGLGTRVLDTKIK